MKRPSDPQCKRERVALHTQCLLRTEYSQHTTIYWLDDPSACASPSCGEDEAGNSLVLLPGMLIRSRPDNQRIIRRATRLPANAISRREQAAFEAPSHAG